MRVARATTLKHNNNQNVCSLYKYCPQSLVNIQRQKIFSILLRKGQLQQVVIQNKERNVHVFYNNNFHGHLLFSNDHRYLQHRFPNPQNIMDLKYGLFKL